MRIIGRPVSELMGSGATKSSGRVGQASVVEAIEFAAGASTGARRVTIAYDFCDCLVMLVMFGGCRAAFSVGSLVASLHIEQMVPAASWPASKIQFVLSLPLLLPTVRAARVFALPSSDAGGRHDWRVSKRLKMRKELAFSSPPHGSFPQFTAAAPRRSATFSTVKRRFQGAFAL